MKLNRYTVFFIQTTQLCENIKIFDEVKPLGEDDIATLTDIGRRMVGCVPCTACRYCVDHCPMELDIPLLLNMYNEQVFTGGGFIVPMTLRNLPKDKKPDSCAGCGGCEAVCPQNIKISEVMADFVKRLG